MREETTTRMLYTFDELSPEAQEHALNELWDLNVDHDWWDCTYVDAKDTAGLTITEFDLDGNRRHIKGNFAHGAEETANTILENHGDQCETYKTAAAFLKDLAGLKEKYPDEDSDEYWEESGEWEDLKKEFLHDILEDYLSLLFENYNYFTSEEAIKETIKCNEYEFTENGDLA